MRCSGLHDAVPTWVCSFEAAANAAFSFKEVVLGGDFHWRAKRYCRDCRNAVSSLKRSARTFAVSGNRILTTTSSCPPRMADSRWIASSTPTPKLSSRSGESCRHTKRAARSRVWTHKGPAHLQAAIRLFHAQRHAPAEFCGATRSWMSRMIAREMRHRTARYCGRPATKASSTRLRAPLFTS